MRRDPGHFYHSDLMFYIGTRIALERRCEVRVVRTADKKTPDLEIPAQRVQIECKAHEVGTATRSLKDDFGNTNQKLHSLPQGWTCLLAVDLGVCGHPSIPMLGKQGPDHTKQTQDAYDQFSSFPRISAVLLTMTSAEFLPDDATGTIGAVCAVDVSGLMYAPTAKKLSILDKVFNEWPIKPDRVAYRRP